MNEEAKEVKESMTERLKQWCLKAIRQPGTYCLIAVCIGLCLLLYRMFELGLFKLSLAGLVLGVGLTGMAIAGFWFFYTRNKMWQIPGVLMCVGLLLLSILGQGQMQAISATLNTISQPAATYVQTAAIYAPSLIPVNDLHSLNGETIGIVQDRDTRVVQALLEDLQNQGITVKTKAFTSLQQIYKAVRGQAIRAVILNPGDVRLIQEFNGVASNSTQLSLVYKLPVDSQVTSPTSDKNLETDPFTVLVSVSSDPLRETSYRSNLNLVVTVNPNTRQIMTTVIPKSVFVTPGCSEDLACTPGGAPDRISFASYHSIEALRQTVEKLFGVPIDFSVRIDMDRLLQLFDISEGKIRLSTDTAYTDVDGGTKSDMSGPQIKRYIGNVDDLSADDMNQELNQLRVLLTLSHAYRMVEPTHLKETMQILEQSVWTSFRYNQLTELLRMFYIFPEPMNATYQLITGTSSTQYSPTLTETTYATSPDQASIDQAIAGMQAVLNGQEPQVSGLPDPASFNQPAADPNAQPADPNADPNAAPADPNADPAADPNAEQADPDAEAAAQAAVTPVQPVADPEPEDPVQDEPQTDPEQDVEQSAESEDESE